MPRKKCPNYLSITLPWPITTGYVSMVTFVGIRSPPWSLPTPPKRRRTLCPSLVLSFFFFFQLPQGRQCLFEVRSVPDWHGIGTNLVRKNPPITFVIVNFFVVSNGVYDLRPQDNPFGDKDLWFDQFQSFDFGIVHLVQIGHGFPESSSSCTSCWAGWRWSIPCLPAFYRIGARGVALSSYWSQEWKRKSIVHLMNFWFSSLPFRKKCPHVQ